ncbi:hypothetical protein Tco_0286040 [Tanacetum coccineum]
MFEPLSPNHVFDFSKDDQTLNEEEFEAEPEEDLEEDPKEESEEAQEMDVDVEVESDDKMNEPELIFPYEGVGSHNPPPPESDTSSNSEPKIATSATVDTVTQDLIPGTMRREIDSLHGRQHMDAFDFDFGVAEQHGSRVEHHMDTLGDRVQKVWAYGFYKEMVRAGVVEERPSEAIDVTTVHGESQPPEPLGPPDGPQLVKNWVAEAIAEYERNRANNLENARGTRPVNARGVNAPEVQGYSYKTFLNCKPHSFNETEGVVGLSRWFEKMESVFEISKCVEEDKVKFVARILEGLALT